MRLSHPGCHPQSHAHLEPLQRLAVIPLVSAILGRAYSLAQSTLHESRSQVVGSPASGFVDPAPADVFPAISTTVQEVALTQKVLTDAPERLRDAGVRARTADWLSRESRRQSA
jgi:hypothetical protein